MATVFDVAVTHTLGLEGAWSDHADDPGGATAWGVTEAVARRHGYEPHKVTAGVARDIYRADYWRPMRCDDVVSEPVAVELFDTAVNVGVGRASRIAQLATNLVGHDLLDQRLAVDGRVGALTVGAINHVCSRGYTPHLVAALNGFQFAHYHRLWREHLWAASFIRGWMLRCLPATPSRDERPVGPPTA